MSALNVGGVENMIYNYYKKMNSNEIEFDFIVHGKDIGMLEGKLENTNSRIFHVTPKKESFWKNKNEIENIIKKGKYDIVHCHQNFSNFVPLFISKQYKVPIRISHSHGYKEGEGIIQRQKNSILRFLNKYSANYFFSCTNNAGQWLHGKKWVKNERNIIMNNAIDIHKFTYDKNIRIKYRNQLKIDEKIILLHVGRFSNEKNHLFLLDILEELIKRSDKYILLLVGTGPNEEIIREQVQIRKLDKYVLFLGMRDDVAMLMNAADVFLLPSKNEGFGMTLIEAQSTGLMVLASEKVPLDTLVTNLIEYLSIDNPNTWVNKLQDINVGERYSRNADLEKAGYSIDVEAIKYQQWIESVSFKR